MKNEIRHYLLNNSASADVNELNDTESLLESGVIDSASMVDLITFLEKTYRISIDEDDLIPENFDSVAAIAGYVQNKLAPS